MISLGVTADSYIVFFERLKDEVRAGRSPRTAVQPAFQRAFKTIVAADIVTGIAAAVLYFTAVSSVRGFALTLGVATALDLFVVYFFKRPTVFLIARNSKLSQMKGFGLASATGADHIAAAGGAGMTFRDAFAVYRGYRVPHLQLIEHRRWWFTFSGVLIVLSLVGMLVQRLPLLDRLRRRRRDRLHALDPGDDRPDPDACSTSYGLTRRDPARVGRRPGVDPDRLAHRSAERPAAS